MYSIYIYLLFLKKANREKAEDLLTVYILAAHTLYEGEMTNSQVGAVETSSQTAVRMSSVNDSVKIAKITAVKIAHLRTWGSKQKCQEKDQREGTFPSVINSI